MKEANEKKWIMRQNETVTKNESLFLASSLEHEVNLVFVGFVFVLGAAKIYFVIRIVTSRSWKSVYIPSPPPPQKNSKT